MNDSPNGVRVQLPFPDQVLNPNKKAHWAKKARFAATARDAAFLLTRNTGVKLNSHSHYTATVLFCPPDHRRRDRDNLLSALKSALDGMCRALEIDDSTLHPIPEIGPVVPGGKVEITIVERKV